MRALSRWVRWQVRSRLTSQKIPVPFVGGTQLLVSHGMAGATGNIYCGLHEFQDMAFVLHALQPNDLFIDIGANVGTYTILAAGVRQARVLAAEPAPATFKHLADNIHLNRLESLVDARNIALGAAPSTLNFTCDFDTVNHVASPGETANTIPVQVLPLDDVLAQSGNLTPTVMKIDVEGFETEVIRGAQKALAAPTLLAVLMELNGSGDRYGYDEKALHQSVLSHGFHMATYDPWTRTLTPTPTPGDNTLYVRNLDVLSQRVKSAPRLTVNAVEF